MPQARLEFATIPIAMTGIWRIRATILTLAGALGVHQGRYLFAPQEHEHELAGVHGYLPWITPALGALVFLAVVQLVARLDRVSPTTYSELPRARALRNSALGMAGTWEARVTARVSKFDEYSARTTFKVRPAG
jgi:hypothetical protein